jgi:hypothetical protein
MAMIDLDAPLMTKQNLQQLGIDRDKYYYIAFFNGDRLDTRPIKITDIYSVNSSSAGSRYLRTEAQFDYHFETEKTITKKIIDPRFWVRLFKKPAIVDEKITEKWKISFTKEWDSIDFYLIGETPDKAKLRLIMAALKTPYPSPEKSKVIDKEMNYYQEHHPDLVMKAMDFRIDTQYGDITDYGDKFLSIEGDLRNGVQETQS